MDSRLEDYRKESLEKEIVGFTYESTAWDDAKGQRLRKEIFMIQ